MKHILMRKSRQGAANEADAKEKALQWPIVNEADTGDKFLEGQKSNYFAGRKKI